MDSDYVKWDDSFSVNLAVIDEQHKQLINTTNELILGCKKSRTAAQVAHIHAIRKAVEYALIHFQDEEKFMKEANYPDLKNHQDEHKAFFDKVVKDLHKFDEGSGSPIELARFLQEWVLKHIANVDQKCAPYFKKL